MTPIDRHKEIVRDHHLDHSSAATLVLAERLAELVALLVAPSTLGVPDPAATTVTRISTPTPTTTATDWHADAVRYLRDRYVAGEPLTASELAKQYGDGYEVSATLIAANAGGEIVPEAKRP